MDLFRIFIVEDDVIYSEILKYHLSLNPDFVLESFSTGRDCLNNLHKKPALVTIDFSLPDMSGKELLGKIRKVNEETGIIMAPSLRTS
jgi:DNA-binding response OmpR family regulator